MAERLPTMYGRYYTISAVWRGKQFTVNVFRPKLQLLQRPGAQRIVDKIYPGSRVISFWESDPTDAPVFLVKEEVTRTMKTFKQFREHCGLKYDVVAHQCGHCNATGYHADGEKCSTCDGRGTLQTVNDGTEMEESNDKKVYSKEHPEAQKNVKKMQKEEAPKGAKYERMVKHIKKSYAKDGKLTDKEKSIAYATAWKHKNKKEEVEIEEGAAWTRKAGQNKEGGLNEKGRKSYERENPGSDLKAPSKKKGNKRRASFCARMKGMKKKLTSKKTARDPDSRINKSLRAWNC